jgi:hypothetical protein
VRNHVQNILVKLDAHSKLAAVAIASHHGLLRREGTARTGPLATDSEISAGRRPPSTTGAIDRMTST